MNYFEVIDAMLLRSTTKFSHWFQRLTGRSNYFIAKIGVFISAITTLIEISNYFSQFLWRKTGFMILVFCVVINIMTFIEANALDKADESLESETRVLHPLLTHSMWSRLLWVGISLNNTGIACQQLLIVKEFGPLDAFVQVGLSYGTLIFYYFCEVEPLRPSKSKIREWLEKFSFTTPTPAEVESSS